MSSDPKSVTRLYGRHAGETIYVVGSGASMRVFPVDFLADKITIGLNMAWKNVPVTYGITIHPEMNIPEFIDGEESRPEITWISNADRCEFLLDKEQSIEALSRFYFFHYHGQPDTSRYPDPGNSGRILNWVREPSDHLYLWSSISQTAVNLAANMGARYIVLVGCDNCSLSGNFHAHEQHTRWKGAAPDYRYRQYYEGLADVRKVLRERGVEVISVTPFLGLNYEEDFARVCVETGRETLIRGRDLSPHPIFYWLSRWRRPIFRLIERLHLVEEMRSIKRWLGMLTGRC